MVHTKDQPATLKDVKNVIYEAMDYMLLKIKKLLSGEMIAKLDEIHKQMVELKYETRMNRMLYSFWAERHLSPELREEFLEFQKKLQEKKMKRVD